MCRNRRRGIALITALVLSVIMLALGLSFLYFLERDYRFAGAQEHSQQAYYLAQAGLTYARTNTARVVDGPFPVIKYVPDGSNYSFELTLDASGRLTSRGIVRSHLNLIIAERTLVVEPGRSARESRDGSL